MITTNTMIFLGIAVGIVLVLTYYVCAQTPVSLSADDKKQKIKILSYEEIISWVSSVTSNNSFELYDEMELTIVPQSLVGTLPLQLSHSEKKNAVILIISHNDDMLYCKIITPKMLSQSLLDILPVDKLYVQKLKTKRANQC